MHKKNIKKKGKNIPTSTVNRISEDEASGEDNMEEEVNIPQNAKINKITAHKYCLAASVVFEKPA